MKEHPNLYRCLDTVRYVLDNEPIAGVPHVRSPMELLEIDLLIGRYYEDIKTYLDLKLRNTKRAVEVARELLVKLQDKTLPEPEGPLRRFRDYLRPVLHRLMVDHYRDRQIRGLPPDLLDESQSDYEFDVVWRAAVHQQSKKRLERYEAIRPEDPFNTLIDLRSEHHRATIKDLAAKLSQKVGRQVTPGECRKMLHQARSLFFDLLLLEVRSTIAHAGHVDITDELDYLGLGRGGRRSRENSARSPQRGRESRARG
jgi:RNA polymerase sigma-70 factor (ECF subfamily)